MVAHLPARLRVKKRAWQAWLTGEPELRLLPRLCDPSALSLDVGANNGVYTYFLHRYSGGVVAFEPQPALAGLLAEAFAGAVRVERVALSAGAGAAALRVPIAGADSGMATIEAANDLGTAPCSVLQVPCRPLDAFDLPRVGFIKIDVEGHELAVLTGARRLLERDRPNLLIEAEDRHRSDAVTTLAAWLGELGYAGRFLAGGRLHPMAELGGDAPGREAAARGLVNFIFVHPARAAARAA